MFDRTVEGGWARKLLGGSVALRIVGTEVDIVEGVVGSARVGGGGAFPFLGEGLVSPFDFGLAGGAAAGAVLVAPIIVFCWVEGLTATREPEEPVFTWEGEAKFAPC